MARDEFTRRAVAPERTTASAAPRALLEAGDTAQFLERVEGQGVVLRSIDGSSRVLVASAAAWVHDPGHALLWSLDDEERLWVNDLRSESPPLELADRIADVSSIWIEWPSNQRLRFVRRETGCEENVNAVEVKVGSKPALRLVESNQRRAFSAPGRRWLAAQAKRHLDPQFAVLELDGGEQISLPASWQGCERKRCGLSVPFGGASWRLVLVRERTGADCVQRSCLLFNPETRQFASPPVLADSQGTLSLAGYPSNWTAADRAAPGFCGPYMFDVKGTTFLVRNYVCRLTGSCQELRGDAVGWLTAGVVAGAPG